MRIDGRQHGDLRRLLAAAFAFEAGGELGEPAGAVNVVDLDPVPCLRRAAGGALDLQRAPEADHVAGRADMLVGHAAVYEQRNIKGTG